MSVRDSRPRGAFLAGREGTVGGGREHMLWELRLENMVSRTRIIITNQYLEIHSP